MPTYQVSLVRSFVIEIRADTPEEAASLSELFIGYSDESSKLDKEKYRFKFEEIEMTNNDAIEVIQKEVLSRDD
jgi:hypothetical protein